MTRRGRERSAGTRRGGQAELRRLVADEQGATYTEYMVIVMLVVVAAIYAWSEWQTAVEDDASEQYTTFGTPPDD